MPNKNDPTDEKIDAKLGMFIEHLNDQFDRVLEAGEGQSDKLQKKLQLISDRLERVEKDSTWIRFEVSSIQKDANMLKLRSDKHEDTREQNAKEVKTLQNRLTKLETA
jgi:archaellum component FlaC